MVRAVPVPIYQPGYLDTLATRADTVQKPTSGKVSASGCSVDPAGVPVAFAYNGRLRRKKGGVVVAGPGEFAGRVIGQQDLAAFCPHRGRDHFHIGWVTTSEEGSWCCLHRGRRTTR